MTKERKSAFLSEARQYYGEFEYVLYFTYTGTTVASITKLRKSLTDSKVIVLKNTINKIASGDSPFKHLSSSLSGQISTIFTNDPVSAAKILADFLAENKTAKFVAFGDKNNTFDYAYLQYVATLPSIGQIRGKLAGLVVAPHAKLIRICNEVASCLARVIDAKSKIS